MISKERLDYFNTALDSIKGVGLVAFLTLAVLYFLFPGMERFVRIWMLDEGRYFYIGKWSDSEKKYMKDLNYRLNDPDFDHATGLVKPGNVILASGDPVVGRTAYGTEEGLATYVGRAGDCLFVLESKARDIKANDSLVDKAIWVHALPKSCK